MKGIQANNINVTLSSNHILKGVSMTVTAGDFVGIIGPNGSGKSTLLKCLYRTLTPDKGDIAFEGQDLLRMPHKTSARKMAVVGQHNELQFDFTVLDMVLLGRAPYKQFMERDSKEDFDIVRNALDKVSMWAYRDRSYGTLSGGEKQRVILARALAQQTDYLILDEPTNHLDIRHQLAFMDLVKSMDKTVLMAVHDLGMAVKYCTKVGVLKKGKMVGFGTVADIIDEKTIRDIYGVRARMVEDGYGNRHIHYFGVTEGI